VVIDVIVVQVEPLRYVSVTVLAAILVPAAVKAPEIVVLPEFVWSIVVGLQVIVRAVVVGGGVNP
jgi:hypothetical protein